jgi:NodT family efflux transporter outer membrane factor (OMF) lipoprotein
LLAAWCGCATGADLIRSDTPAASQVTAGSSVTGTEVPKNAAAPEIHSEWLTLFRSPQINALIKRAFKTNPDFEAAQTVLQQAQLYTAERQGYFYPAVGASPSSLHNKQAGVMGGGSANYNMHFAQLTVGYVPDVFDANRRNKEPAKVQAELQRMQLDAIHITLASNVVAVAIQEASLRAQIGAQLKIIGLNRQALEIARNQLNLGYVTEQDVTQQEMISALAQQALVPLQQQLDLSSDLLHVLTGTPDTDEGIEGAFTLEDLRLLQKLPLSLSSGIVEQRPDVRIAVAQLRSAGAQYGLAVTKTLPQFTITGSTGGMASSPKWMIKSGGRFFDPKSNAAQAIFGAGKLRSKSRAAQQVLTRAATQYRSVVMVALQDVADALHVIQSDARALKATENRALAAIKKGELMSKQYEAGSVDFQILRVAQQNGQLATINLVQAQTNMAGDSVALFQALGGRWWKRGATDLAKAKQSQVN